MTDEPQTRDGVIAEKIAAHQNSIDTIRKAVDSFITQAGEEGAEGHARLYTDVKGSLDDAWEALDEAWSVMAEGNPEDYVS